MRVAMLGLYPVRPDWVLGGVEAVIAMLSQRLSEDPEIDLHVITFRGGEAGGKVVSLPGGLVIHRIGQPRFGRLTWHRAEIRRLQEALDSVQPHLVHAHYSVDYTAAVDHGLPTVLTIHGIMAREAKTLHDLRERAARTLDGWFERIALRKVQNLIAISPYVLEANPWLQASHAYHIENPVHDRFFDVVHREEALRILCPVRVIPRKGLLFALEALRDLVREFPGATLQIAGETGAMPSYLETCESFIARHDLSRNVGFLDNLDPSALAQEYSRCTVMLLPSMQETAPVTIGEAMAARVPIVATRVGGIPQMVQDGVTGMLVDYGDRGGLTAALRTVLSDSALRRDLGERGRAHAESRFRLASVAEQTKQVYQAVLQREAIKESR